MYRKETTELLSSLLIREKLSVRGKYWAREVTLDYGTKNVRRIDFMQFQPTSQIHISGIEKGIFICYEIKSCKADFESGFGRNFIGEKNYFVMPMSVYKEVIQDIPYNVGVMVPVPMSGDKVEEFNNPTELDRNREWELSVIKSAHNQDRSRPMNELLFCMLRSGH